VTSLDDLRRIVEAALERSLPSAAPDPIVEAMRYGLMGGGKRLRPCLTLATAEAIALRDRTPLGDARARALPAACAIEFIHSYSLVHDDLPAMDDDDLRRGRPTTHVVHGDGMAVLAGDGLLTHAFALIAEGPAPPDRRLRAALALATAAGAHGMVGGQAIDLIAAGKVTSYPATPMDAVTLKDMHAAKTGALPRRGDDGRHSVGCRRRDNCGRRSLRHAISVWRFRSSMTFSTSKAPTKPSARRSGKTPPPANRRIHRSTGSTRQRSSRPTASRAQRSPSHLLGLGGLLPEIADLTVSRRADGTHASGSVDRRARARDVA
jgi:hypothetical protein